VGTLGVIGFIGSRTLIPSGPTVPKAHEDPIVTLQQTGPKRDYNAGYLQSLAAGTGAAPKGR
jgi:hypothetical protein